MYLLSLAPAPKHHRAAPGHQSVTSSGRSIPDLELFSITRFKRSFSEQTRPLLRWKEGGWGGENNNKQHNSASPEPNRSEGAQLFVQAAGKRALLSQTSRDSKHQQKTHSMVLLTHNYISEIKTSFTVNTAWVEPSWPDRGFLIVRHK